MTIQIPMFLSKLRLRQVLQKEQSVLSPSHHGITGPLSDAHDVVTEDDIVPVNFSSSAVLLSGINTLTNEYAVIKPMACVN